MEYYKPLQYLGFAYFKNSGEVFIKSLITVLTRKGENLAKYNVPLSTYLIQYRVINDAYTDRDTYFRDAVYIKADAKISGAVKEEINRRDTGRVYTKTSAAVSVKVAIYFKDGTLAGTVTTTTPINDDADIEIR